MISGDSEAQEAATTLLMVEDEADTAVLMRYVLEAKGFHVWPATSGQAAKGVLDRGGPPDLVLLDITLPDMSGLEFLRMIRQTPRWDHVPVVVVTASHEAGHKMRATTLGITAYLTKPLSPIGLPGRLRRLLADEQQKRTATDCASGAPHARQCGLTQDGESQLGGQDCQPNRGEGEGE